ncbi:MAG: hypothetical protein R6U11_08715 [Bacteroidales bacterium]
MKKVTYFKAITMLVIALLFAGCNGETQKNEETSEGNDDKKVEESSTLNITKGKVNKDMVVEVLAQVTYLSTMKYADEQENATAEEMGQISEKISKEIEDVYEEMEVTEDEIDAYSEKWDDKPEKAMKISQKITKRAAELQKAGK